MKIAILDYGMGNINSITSTLKYLGVNEVVLTSDYNSLKSADQLILPGVGSFRQAMIEIKKNKLDIYLKDIVIDQKKPLLGICLGMQLLGKSSTEDGFTTGLGFVDGKFSKFEEKLKVPHVGFNQVKINNKLKLYKDIVEKEVDFYFTHSYKMSSNSNINQCHCYYSNNFIASFETKNICGVQYHPELSQTNGLKVLNNFINNF
ncbi:imidazole glycerol phosphate synthase subunit HisH [Flavobacteriaceae bacterium]|nr:imidazole glycerol phosphate synthase subunit HisH [Flavobacteriaceae bacterium]